jgi:hypothetical protein
MGPLEQRITQRRRGLLFVKREIKDRGFSGLRTGREETERIKRRNIRSTSPKKYAQVSEKKKAFQISAVRFGRTDLLADSQTRLAESDEADHRAEACGQKA